MLRKGLKREFRLIKSTLRVGLKKDISNTTTGTFLKSKGFLTKKGFTNSKGKKAIRLL